MDKKNQNIAILILAAGSSSRLGRPKQLLEINGKNLLQRMIEVALVITPEVTVVLGANEKLIRPTITHFPIDIVLNTDWEEGMSSSIRSGMFYLEKKTIESVLILLSDQPHVDVFLLKKLIDHKTKTKQPIIASQYQNKLGVPAIFDRSLFEKLKSLKGKKGAKQLIINNLKKTIPIVFEKGKIDIDTEEDWKNFKTPKT